MLFVEVYLMILLIDGNWNNLFFFICDVNVEYLLNKWGRLHVEFEFWL
jgi:hypothetical protein